LERPQFTKKPSVAAVTDRAEVLGIKLREKRITIVQVWIMRAEARFQNLATITYCFESLARSLAATVVSAQIAQRLFAFEDCC
jgi:hypothetical protein